MFPTLTLLILGFLTLFAGTPALSAQESGATTTVRLSTFPPEATLSLLQPTGPRELAPVGREDRWRVYASLPADGVLSLSAPGFEPVTIHLSATAAPSASIEERLVPATGPLKLLAELPTGASPKSVVFLPDNRIVVPLLRGPGADVFRLAVDRWGQPQVEPDGRIAPPSVSASEGGFVEPLVVPARGELWISQMNTNEIHRFDLTTLAHEETRDSGGTWPKVMTVSGEYLVVANWYSETVDFLPLSPPASRSFRSRLPVGPAAGDGRRSVSLIGEPRGMVVAGSPPELWICEFSTGDITILDFASGEEIDRLSLGPGAARHIVAGDGGRRLYYSDMYHGTVSVIDRVSRRVVRRRRLGINLNTIALDPAGRYLYVSERGRNNSESFLLPGPEFGRIFVLDPESLDVIQTIWGRHQPTGLAVSPDGRYLATTDFLDDNLAVYRVAD